MRHLKGLVTWDSRVPSWPLTLSCYFGISGISSVDLMVRSWKRTSLEIWVACLAPTLCQARIPTMALSWSLHYSYDFLLFCNVPSKALNSFKIFMTWRLEPGGDGIVSGGWDQARGLYLNKGVHELVKQFGSFNIQCSIFSIVENVKLLLIIKKP
jgi:hypothetical protein